MQQQATILGDAKAGGRLRFFTQYVQNIPISSITFSSSTHERTIAVTTAKTHYEADDTAALLTWADAELVNGRTDAIHDLLAYLAEQMIALNKDKQTAVENFWLDLEGAADPADFAKLRHKGKWEQSLHKHVPASRPHVAADSRSTVHLDQSLGWNEDAFKGFVKQLAGRVAGLSRLVHVYRDHAPHVAALNHRLAATDHLIDQIVYKLYNLTPEEIAIVENQ
jgi:hypothetical protein